MKDTIKTILAMSIICLIMVSAKAYSDISVVTPVFREDGTAVGLSEIYGYRVYYGTVSGDLQKQYDHVGAKLPDTIIPFNKAGDYFCAVTAVDIDKRESLKSPEFACNTEKARLKAPVAKWVVESTGSSSR